MNLYMVDTPTMTVREKFKEKGIFEAISEIQTMPFSELIPVPVMDTLYKANYGSRLLSESYHDEPIESIANMLITVYGRKWTDLYEVALTKVATDYNYTEQVSETIDDDGATTADFVSKNIDAVNAYNDDNFVNDSKTDTTNQNKGTNQNKRIRELTKKLLKGTMTENLNEIISYLQNDFFNGIIIADVNALITLSIFE